MSTVFLSHSHADKEFVRKLASDLSANGVRVWLDEVEIKVGDSLFDKIDNAIRTSDYVVTVLSKDSMQSRWVQKEISAALNRQLESGATSLLPVVIDADMELPGFLSAVRYVDLSTPEKYADGLLELVHAIRAQRSQQSPRPSDLIDVPDLAKEVALEVAQILKTDQGGIRVPSNGDSPGDSKLVFVIISFSNDMEPVFEGIQAAGQAHDLRVERVKDVPGDYRITDKIMEMIADARIVVADLTHERPNVYFELGYARGIGKRVITTAREETKLHFDVKDWTCTFYNDSRTLERHLRERFEYEMGTS